MRVTRLDRYVLARLTLNFGFFALVMVAVYWVNRAVGLFDELIADGQSALVFLEFTALTLPNVIRLVLPVAGFAAAVYVTNRLRSDSELVVTGAVGMSPWRVARGVLAYGVVLALMMSALVHVLAPISRDRLDARSAEVSRDSTGRILREGAFVHPTEGITFYVRRIEPDGGLRDVFLSDSRGGRTVDYVAREAHIARPLGIPHLVLTDGEAHEIVGGRLSVTRFADLSYDISTLVRQEADRSRGVRERTTATILARGSTPEGILEIHRRLAETLFCIAGALLGYAAMTMGAFNRFGSGPQIGVAVVSLILMKGAEGVAVDAMGDAPSRWALHYVAPGLGFLLAGAFIAFASRKRRVGRAIPA